jgi:hypothetical protein
LRMKCVSVSVCGVVLWSLRFDLSWVGLGCLIPSGSSWMLRIHTPHICTDGSRRGHGVFFPQRNLVCCCEAVDVDVGEDQSAVRIFGRVFASSSDDLYYNVYGRMVDGY